jgi:hypothetical protein
MIGSIIIRADIFQNYVSKLQMGISTSTTTTTSGCSTISNSSSREALHTAGNIKFASFFFSGPQQLNYLSYIHNLYQYNLIAAYF